MASISQGHMEGSSLSFAPSILGQDHKNPVQRQGGGVDTVSLKMQQKHLVVSCFSCHIDIRTVGEQ